MLVIGMGIVAIVLLVAALASGIIERTPIMSENQKQRVRQICLALPAAMEKLSHGEPAFFVGKKVFAMFANHHHHDGHVAVWVPMPAGLQRVLIENTPGTFFKPPYMGVRGWVGIELSQISDNDLASHLREAWSLIAPKKVLAAYRASQNAFSTSDRVDQ